MRHPLDVICAVLRHRLNGERLDPGVIPALKRGGIGERRLVAVASRHRVTPAFAACLGDLGLDKHLAPELRDYFAFMRASSAGRNRELRDALGAIVTRLNGLGVEPCLVKGAARLVDGLYPDDGWRVMADLDLLVPEERLRACVDALRADGYEAQGPDPVDPDDVKERHYPGLLHPRSSVAVELHKRLTDEPYTSLLPVHEILTSSRTVHSSVGRVRLLKNEHAISHLIWHFQLDHLNHFLGIIRLSDAIELHLLITRFGSDLDWACTLDRFERPDWRRACLALIGGTRALLGTPIPEAITFDPLTRLRVARMLGQQRFRSAMAIGIALGWIHHFKHRRGRARFLARLAADPKKYLRLFVGQKDWA